MTSNSGSLTLHDLLRELAKVRGLDFRGYKLNSLERRLRKRMSQLNFESYDEYAKYFHANPNEITELLQTVLINVTSFFRDPPAWEALRQFALSGLLGNLRPGDSFRAWCAGCSTGEEVYSLAIVLAEHFGPRLKDYEIKIYATDYDEDALNVASRGEYAVDRVRNLKAELRKKYFSGGNTIRINRDLRRLVIFGRSNLVSDAPISHVNLLICRNVLIYFDLSLQKQVLQRFHYALEEGGILFLGRAESQLRESVNFRTIHPKWRIFQCAPKEQKYPRTPRGGDEVMDKGKREVDTLRNLQTNLLETLRQAVIVLDENDAIVHGNSAAFDIWGVNSKENLKGRKILSTIMAERCGELGGYLQRTHVAGSGPVQFRTKIRVNNEDRLLSVTLKSVLNEESNRDGTLIYAEDVSHQEKLRVTVEELEATAEELHSANEELETTNEELQSTNEELETTNEELQSTNEELHSLNEELETTNDELEMRTRELDETNKRYAETLERMPLPVMLVGDDEKVMLWNSAAHRLFGLESKIAVGLKLSQLPLPTVLRNPLNQRMKDVLAKQQPANLQIKNLTAGSFQGSMGLDFTLVNNPSMRAVLVIFDPERNAKRDVSRSSAPSGARKAAKKKTATPAKAKAKGRKKGR